MNASITSSHSADSILCPLVPVSAQPMHDFTHPHKYVQGLWFDICLKIGVTPCKPKRL